MSVTIRFCGAARTVTGSCYLFETPRRALPGRLRAVSGTENPEGAELRRLSFSPRRHRCRAADPRPYRSQRPVAQACAQRLCRPHPGDARHHRSLLLHAARRRQYPGIRSRGAEPAQCRAGTREVTPIYTQADAIAALQSFSAGRLRKMDRRDSRRSRPLLECRASARLRLDRDRVRRPQRIRKGRSAFSASGDIGPDAKLLQPDPEAPSGFDYVISESTYGDRDRPPTTPDARRARLAAEVRDAGARKGALLIPAFAVERTQELIVDLVDLMERGEIPAAPIFLDSPLAIRATEVFRKHAESLDPTVDVRRLLNSPQLRFTETVEESKAIAKLTGFHIIIAASGMCDAGRIRHHLRNWLWNASATVLLVGFQAQGTLGRFLVDGAKAVRIQGNEIKVAAQFAPSTTIPGMPTDRNWRAGSPLAGRFSGAFSRPWRGAGHCRPRRSCFRADHSGGADFSAAAR